MECGGDCAGRAAAGDGESRNAADRRRASNHCIAWQCQAPSGQNAWARCCQTAVADLTGLDPSQFEIQNLASGAPVVVSLDGRPMPHISISHRDGEAIAIATPSGRAGIDMECVEQRAASFAETWFRPTERAHCQGDARRESQVWAVKEAVLKVLGTGMRLDPREVEVLSMEDNQVHVRLWGAAHARCRFGWRNRVDLEDEQTMVIAVAWMAS